MNEEREAKIDQLREQIYALEQEELADIQKAILPFLIEHAKFSYHYGSAIQVNLEPADKDELYRLIDPNSGSYHMQGKISENANIHISDGEVTIYFGFSGKPSEIRIAAIKEAKRLGLKVSFEDVKNSINGHINREQEQMAEIESLEKLYNE